MEPRLRIALVTETWPPEVNGVARTIAITVEGLRARGHAVSVVRPRQGPFDDGGEAGELLRPGMPIPRYAQLRLGLPSRRALLEAWRRERPDLVHIVTEGPLGWSALAAARALGVPVSSGFHTNFHSYSSHYGFGWIARGVTAYLRGFHNRAGCTLVPTDEMARELERLGYERLRVVGRGVRADVFSPAKRDAGLRRGWGARDDAPVALCVSRFAPEKDFPLVLDAFRAMRAARAEARLVLVGEGPLAAELKHAVEAERLGAVVNGRLDDDALAAHYASADVFLFASATETFGNVVMEAIASGLALVAFDYAAARQHLVHGRSALLAPLGARQAFIEHAAALAHDLPRARALGAHAREAAEPHGWDRMVDDFEAALRGTLVAGAAAGEAQHAAA
jgi:glycosyltransferase involved in cell wall biosynthesis